MKKCPYCAEEIQDEAIKCRYCGEFLSGRRPRPKGWYFTPAGMVVLFLMVGPLMLPLVWWHPRMSRNVKVVWTCVILLITIGLYQAFQQSLQQLRQMENQFRMVL